MNNTPLPEPDYPNTHGGRWTHSDSNMHAHAAAVTAAKDARIKVLEDALRKAIAQNEHDMLMTGEELRVARALLGDKNG